MPPPVAVITGSTRGIGRALAEAFLARGWAVSICGRSDAAVASAIDALSPLGPVTGKPCDVTSIDSLRSLAAHTEQTFGGVDVWINNAGTCNATRPFRDLDPAEVDAVVRTNLLGTMHGSRVALEALERRGGGKLFNMEGWGSRGEWTPGMTVYTTTKLALRFFTDALVRETRGSPLLVGTLSPGMVITDLLESSYEHGIPDNFARMRFLFNFVIDPPDVVCSWLAERVIATHKTGAHHTWMTPWRLLPRFFIPRYWRRNAFANTRLDRLGR